MIRFHIILSLLFIILFASTTTFNALPPALFSGRPLHPSSTTMPPASTGLQSEKRRVPTGSNPLHNKRKL
ncbi:hypothetical protein HanRHA438_Chr12g0557501 [Helianthus annuus]|nr:hypothetical protein HanIR_Chr12g0589231 [Helianthus annuus]KAJ0866944.1 hypothetical protein HanRHA438_Chr12g0557501 [Helianthus annuus]